MATAQDLEVLRAQFAEQMQQLQGTVASEQAARAAVEQRLQELQGAAASGQGGPGLQGLTAAVEKTSRDLEAAEKEGRSIKFDPGKFTKANVEGHNWQNFRAMLVVHMASITPKFRPMIEELENRSSEDEVKALLEKGEDPQLLEMDHVLHAALVVVCEQEPKSIVMACSSGCIAYFRLYQRFFLDHEQAWSWPLEDDSWHNVQ